MTITALGELTDQVLDFSCWQRSHLLQTPAFFIIEWFETRTSARLQKAAQWADILPYLTSSACDILAVKATFMIYYSVYFFSLGF